MFAYFQTYLKGLQTNEGGSRSPQNIGTRRMLEHDEDDEMSIVLKRPHQYTKNHKNKSGAQSQKRLMNFSQNDQQQHYFEDEMVRDQVKMGLDSERTVRNSLSKREAQQQQPHFQYQVSAQTTRKQTFSGNNNLLGQISNAVGVSHSQNPNVKTKVLKQELHLKFRPSDIGLIGSGPSQQIQILQQKPYIMTGGRSPPPQMSPVILSKNSPQTSGPFGRKQIDSSATKDFSVQDTMDEFDVYKNFLDHNQSNINSSREIPRDQLRKEELNQALRKTVIRGEQMSGKKAQAAIQVYKDEIRDNHQANTSITPPLDYLVFSNHQAPQINKAGQKLPPNVPNLQINFSKQKHLQKPLMKKSTDKTLLSPSGTVLSPQKSIVLIEQTSSKYSSQRQKKIRVSGVGGIRNREREMTYESERSSIFNENLNMVDTQNRNNFNQQYAHKEEEAKKPQPDSSIFINTNLDFFKGADSSRSQSNNTKTNTSMVGGNSNYQIGLPQAIQQTRVQQLLELNLRMQNLTTLSESMFSKSQFLRTVDLRNNKLSAIPDCICNLNLLWKLRLDFNSLVLLPSNLGNLERLEVLTISNNKLSKLPESISLLQDKLGMLQLNDNQLKRIPNSIGYMTKLKVLLLHNNHLRRVPSTLYQLREMHEFSLEWFSYLQPPINKILKDERGLLIIKDFMKFCKTMNEILPRGHQCRFVHFICYFNRLNSIDQLQKMNVFPKQRQVLHYICLYGHQHLLKDLIQAYPQLNLNLHDQDRTTPLILAFKNKQISVINYMMKFPVTNLNEGSLKYGYPLHLGIKNHDFGVVGEMLRPKHVVNINAKDTDGNTAMHFLFAHFGYDSQACGRIGVTMLKKGIEVNTLNKSELSPLHSAIKAFQSKSLKFALEYNSYLTQQQALAREDLNSPSQTKNQGSKIGLAHLNRMQKFNFNLPGKNGWTPLHYAVHNNNLIAVEILLCAQQMEKIDVLVRDQEGKLPQDLCPFNSPIYKMIVRRQQKVIAQKILGNTPPQTLQNDQVILQHTHINRGYRKQQNRVLLKTQQSLNKEENIQGYQMMRRVNSNQVLVRGAALRSQRSAYGGGQEMSDADQTSNFEESFKQNIRESIINQNTVEKMRGKTLERGGQGIMVQSKTEKNLHNFGQVFLSNQTRIAEVYKQNLAKASEDLLHPRTIDDLSKRSPRLQHPIPHLPPKHLLNHDEDQEQFEIEEMFRQESLLPQSHGSQPDFMRFMSHHINFDSDQDDNNEYFNKSMSVEGSSSSDDSDTDILPPRFSIIQENSFFQRTDKLNLKFSGQKSKIFEIQNSELQQYQSAPAERQSAIHVQQQEDRSASSLSVEEEKQTHLQTEKRDDGKIGSSNDDSDEDDFCDAADEDAEAGALGLIANKINKFDNTHNKEQEYKSLNEKESMKKIVGEMEEIKKRRKGGFMKMRDGQIRSKGQLLSPRVDQAQNWMNGMKASLDNPFDLKDLGSPDVILITLKDEEEGNVFDTVERFPEYCDASSNVFSPKSMYDPEKFAHRQIRPRNNIFINTQDNINAIPIMKSQQVNSRKSIQGINSSKRLDESGYTNFNGAKLQYLNQDCKLDSEVFQSQIDDCIKILNDQVVSLSQKYTKIYSVIYQHGKIIDEKRIKLLFDSLDDENLFSQIIKADLSYLLSLSKNKDFIPQLDIALSKYKQSALTEKRQALQKSPEPSSKKSDATLKTPLGFNESQSQITKIGNQSNCKQLIIYETCNAFDIMMQDAMIQSKLMMEQCNQRINQEREKSREKIKLKSARSNYQQLHTSASGDLSLPHYQRTHYPGDHQQIILSSVKDMPEFISRLNKSPSTQSIQNLKRLGQPQTAYGDPRDFHDMYQPQMMMVNSNLQSSQSSIAQGNGTFFQRKVSFTPKGSSGQVFLAFQRQKQTQELQEDALAQHTINLPTFSGKDGFNPQSLVKTIDLGQLKSSQRQLDQVLSSQIQQQIGGQPTQSVVIPENFNETLIQNQPQRPQYMEPLSHAKVLQTTRDISSLNMSASSNTTTPFQGQNLAIIISNTISELRADSSMGQLDNQAALRSILVSGNKMVKSGSKGILSYKQKELSQQIQQNLASKPVKKHQQAVLSNQVINRSMFQHPPQQPSANLSQPSGISHLDHQQSMHQHLAKSQSTQKLFGKQSPPAQHQVQPIFQNQSSSNTQLRKPNKIALNKQSPLKASVMRAAQIMQDVSFDKGNLTQKSHQSQTITQVNLYSKGAASQRQKQQHMEETKNQHIVKFQTKQVKYNLSVDQQQNKNFKKSTSTSKLNSESSFI